MDKKKIISYTEIAVIVLLTLILMAFIPKWLFIASLYSFFRFYKDSFKPHSVWLYLILLSNFYSLFCLHSLDNNIALPLYFLFNQSFYFIMATLSVLSIYNFSIHWKDTILFILLFLFPFQFFWMLFTSNMNDHAILYGDGRTLFQDFYSFSLLKNGFLPFWNHFTNNGVAHFYDNLTLGSFFFPIKFVILFSFYNSNLYQFYHALAFYQITMISIGLCGMYCLLRMYKFNKYSSLSGAIVFGFNPYIIKKILSSNLIDPYVMSPWILMAIIKVIPSKSYKYIAFAAVVFFMESFLSLPWVYLQVIFLIIFIFVYYALNNRQFDYKSINRLLIAVILSALLAGFCVFPTINNIINGDAVRSLQPSYGYAVESYLTFSKILERYLFFDINVTDDSFVHYGIMALILTIFYLFGIKDKNKPIFLSIFIFFFLLSTAHIFFFRDLIYLYVPGMDQKKMQTGFSFLQNFSVAYFTAAFIHYYSQEKDSFKKINTILIPFLILSVVIFIYLAFINYTPESWRQLKLIPGDYNWFFKSNPTNVDTKIFASAFFVLCLFSLYFFKKRLLSIVLLLLIFTELTTIAKYKAPLYYNRESRGVYKPWTGTYLSYNFFIRPLNVSGQKVNFSTNFLGQYLENQISMDGYSSYVASHKYLLMASYGSEKNEKKPKGQIELGYGVKVKTYDGTKIPFFGIHPEHMQPYAKYQGLAKNPNKFKDLFYGMRVKLYNDIKLLNMNESENKIDYELRILREIDSSDINTKLIVTDVEPGKFSKKIKNEQAFLRSTATAESPTNTVQFLPATYNTLNLKISNKDNRILFVNTNYHPDWRAFIQGKEVPVYRGHFNFMAVPIPQGNFELEMKFIPKYFYLGLLVSATTILVLVLIVSFLYFRRKESFKWSKYALIVLIILIPYCYLLFKLGSIKNLTDMDRPPHKVYAEIKSAQNKAAKEKLFIKHGHLMSVDMFIDLHYEFGKYYYEKGDFKKSKLHLKKVLQMNPGHIGALEIINNI